MTEYTMDYLRNQIIGKDAAFTTPFGKRHVFYADYTASGRGLAFIEEKMRNIMKSYANSHTEDDYTGIFTTRMLHEAEAKIKSLVNAGPQGQIILTGNGATGALERLQKIIGIYQTPPTRDRIKQCLTHGVNRNRLEEFEKTVRKSCPVVFIGPYEHHSNELMWRESLAEVVVIGLNRSGLIDLGDLEKRLSDPVFANRDRFASFSAGSNITGIQSDVYEIARICHDHDTPIFFDFAAVAPYAEIDMNRDKRRYFDAVFFSPHKFLGGPGASGVLIFNKKLYNPDLPPTTAGGGTVDYVGFNNHDFSRDIETREKPGTPGILQAIKSALVLDLKQRVGLSVIREIEKRNMDLFFSRLQTNPKIHFLGNMDPGKRVPIISFNIKHGDRILHPKFVTKLLNDLFGIQSRAGCSCAGPYGHILLDIDDRQSQKYRRAIARGLNGLKPGWVRVNLHYIFSEEDIRFLTRALDFVAEKGHLFLRLYEFYLRSGEWVFRDFVQERITVDLDQSFNTGRVDITRLESLRGRYLQEAEQWANKLERRPPAPFKTDEPETEALKYFYYVHVNHSPAGNLCCCTV